jgi:small GTP-binding protein
VDRDTLLNEHYQDFLQAEKTLLWDIHNCILKTGPKDTDVTHLQEMIAQLDELFLLVVVGEFNSGKSAFINALIEQKVLEEGPTPTTDMITILKYGEESSSRIVDNVRVTRFPLELLKNINIVDTPGTNSIIRGHDELTMNFIPKADFVVFVISADRPLTDSEREFLELISLRWKRKVLFLLNKIDTKDERDIRTITEYLAREGKHILELTPIIFPVSVKWAFEGKTTRNAALLQQSRFANLEQHLLTALTEDERIRLKLLNPIYAVQPICRAATEELQQKLTAIEEDLQRLQRIEKQLVYTETDLKESYSRFMLNIKNILLDLRNRAYDFVEEFLQVQNIWNIRSKEKIERQFDEKVVKDASQQIEEVLTEASDWMVQKNMKVWDDTLEYYKQQLYRNGRQDKIFGEVGGKFAYDRDSIYQRVIKEARTKLKAFNFQEESQNILKAFQKAMFQFAATEVGAIGIGAVLIVIFEALLLDITGILASGALVTAGFFILPHKRRKAKETFNVKIQELINDLETSISQQFDAYMHASFAHLKETLSPFDRFCRAEHDELEAAQGELVTLIQKLNTLQHEIQQQLSK